MVQSTTQTKQNQKTQGTIVRWQDDKGFGFIQTEHKGDIFFHISDYRAKTRPVIGESVVFEIGVGKNNQPCAKNVQQSAFVQQQVARKNAQAVRQQQYQASNQVLLTWVGVAVGFMGILAVLVLIKVLPMVLLGWYGAVGLATFLLYAHDKNSAQNGSWRVAEATLHKLALAGGWVGAVFAHYFLRHKSQKPEFRKNFYITVVGNIIGLLVIYFIKLRYR
ncbi:MULTISPECIES: DUF1294 domain-containing protein [unclassified Moraxella]|uniref:DUF1294 domain-containing protein n=1 Tax=unclassified Moraxella TaxID=2685852 RepID=UPI003AF96D58